MKNASHILSILACAAVVSASPSNEVIQSGSSRRYGGGNRPEGERRELQERRLQLMEKSLNEIGVTEEQRQAVLELQKTHREKMHASMRRIAEAREQLSRLQDEGAEKEALDKAIEAVSDAQAEQLRILVHNRMEMERILGREKYALIMERARMQFRKHGRRGGSGLPPRPGLPPTPTDTPPTPAAVPTPPPTSPPTP